MKKINDSDIKKIFNDSSRYEIKLSSEDITKNVPILNEEKPVKKKKTILFPLLISLSSLTLASLIIGSIFVIGFNKENNDYNSLLSPANNKYLDAQLLSFKAFSSNNTSSLLNKKKYMLNYNEFEEIVNKYEQVQDGVKDLFNLDSFKLETEESSFSFEGVSYCYETRFLNNQNEIDSIIYFNEIESKKDDDELKTTLEAIYSFSNSLYYVDITFKEESSNKKNEKEVKSLFRNTDSNDKKVILVKSEEEYNGKKSENSYSFSKFNSYSDYIIDEDNFIEKIEYEIENNDINVEIETINSEIEFIDITKINENSYSFCVDEYLSSLNNEITNVLISLLYNEDNSRTYSYKNLIITKK